MGLNKEQEQRAKETQSEWSEEAKRLRRNFALMMLEKLDAQIKRGRITPSPRKDSLHGLSAGS